MINSGSNTLLVRSGDQQRIVEKLARLGRIGALVGPAHQRWSAVYDEPCLYDDDQRDGLAARLSGALECQAVTVSLIKYNQLQLDFFEAGARALTYELDLDPIRGAPSPEKCDRAAEGVAARLLPLCRAGTPLQQLDRLLRALEVSSGHMEWNPAAGDSEAAILQSLQPALLALPMREISRESALQMVEASHASTRRDYATFMALPDAGLLETIGRLRDSAAALAATAEQRGNDSRARKWKRKVGDCEAWIAAGASGARAGMQRRLDELDSHTEREVEEAIEFNRAAKQRIRKRFMGRPAVLRERAADFRQSPRPLRAASVLDVLRDLCGLLEMNFDSATCDTLVDVPGYPDGFVEVAG